MKRIYFNTTGYYDTILAEKDVSNNNYGYYWVKDILGREHYFPISNSYVYVEEWDGTTEGIAHRFLDVIKELRGTQTGALTKQTK